MAKQLGLSSTNLMTSIIAALSTVGQTSDQPEHPLFAPGVHILIADTGEGKTTLARDLAAAAPAYMVELEEPTPTSYISLAEFAQSLTVDEEDENGKVTGLMPRPDLEAQLEGWNSGVVVIDSFRIQQFSIPGNATTGGVSSGLYSFLTAITIAALRKNVSLIVTMNPLAPAGSQFAAELMSRIKSSVTSVVYKESGARTGDWIISSRALSDRTPQPLAKFGEVAGVAADASASYTVKPSRQQATNLGFENIKTLSEVTPSVKGLSEPAVKPDWVEETSIDTLFNNLNWSNTNV